jgi:ubiquinone/menaquinone biosynthesis C-methylase UbiE
MTNPVQPSERKQQVTLGFNLASTGYDKPALRFLPTCAKRLVELAKLQSGQKVLDIATGTGTAAIAIANQVGSTGKIVGIDLAPEMLEQAQQKISAAGIANIELRQEDAEKLSFDDKSFDAAICASGIFFLPDMLVGLREWQRVLKPIGLMAFSSFAETAFEPMAEILDAQLRSYGVQIPSAGGRLGTPEKCLNLMQEAGFKDIEIQTEQLGYYLGSVDEWWELVWNAGFRIRLSQIPAEKLEQFKAEHLAEIETLMTDQGIWLDVETIFVMGKKPLDEH